MEYKEEAEKESKPNWREAFEQTLAKGGAMGGYDTCRFCLMAGFKAKVCDCDLVRKLCLACPLNANGVSEELREAGGCIQVIDNDFMDNSERRAICRHVLATVQDFTDVAEIRERIAEMLDPELREKFVGKAEKWVAATWDEGSVRLSSNSLPGHAWQSEGDMKYVIYRPSNMGKPFIAVNDEDTRDRVLEFLNKE